MLHALQLSLYRDTRTKLQTFNTAQVISLCSTKRNSETKQIFCLVQLLSDISAICPESSKRHNGRGHALLEADLSNPQIRNKVALLLHSEFNIKREFMLYTMPLQVGQFATHHALLPWQLNAVCKALLLCKVDNLVALRLCCVLAAYNQSNVSMDLRGTAGDADRYACTVHSNRQRSAKKQAAASFAATWFVAHNYRTGH